MADRMTAEEFFLLVGALVEGRRAAFRRRCTVAFAVVDAGPFYVDTSAKEIVERRWTDEAQVSVLTNERTLSDLIAGLFDPASPRPEHLFVWGGDRGTWETFSRALTGGGSAIDARLALKKEAR